MKNLYTEIHKAITDEMIDRESTLDIQREIGLIKAEATKVTKEVVGTILESIERNWQP